ncbi:MAG: LysR family transcriptional regulator [Selenomonadaceae bacterium]|nr:LysR family transcriptional regulator [Selenomonadaceae bacterium]
MIDLQQLIYLKTVAECGTISKAAEILHVSQPAISRAIQRLEEDLQVKIFNRNRNRVELNENGGLALKFAEKILEDSKEMIEQIRAFDRSRRTISIGSIAPAPMIDLIPTLNRLFPDQIISTELIDE